MRCLNRNKSKFFYAPFKEKREIKDEYGNVTTESEVIYENPIKAFGNISAANGETIIRQFGEKEAYDKVIVMNRGVPIDEYAVLWIDRLPLLTEQGELATDENGNIVTPHDYIVKKVAQSLNSITVAIKKVNVSG